MIRLLRTAQAEVAPQLSRVERRTKGWHDAWRGPLAMDDPGHAANGALIAFASQDRKQCAHHDLLRAPH